MLNQMANARGVRVYARTPGHATKQELVSALRTADNDPRSFLGLPPELRVMVYRELLVFESPTTGCCPKVLRLCRQVYDEARAVLEDENTVHIRLHSNRVAIQAQEVDFCYPGLDKKTKHLLWSPTLRNIQRLHVSVAFVWIPPAMDFPGPVILQPWEMSRDLYSLCAFLAGKHRCKVFELDLRALGSQRGSPLPGTWWRDRWSRREWGDFDYDSLLWPLNMLGTLDSLTVTISTTNVIRRTDSAFSNTKHRGDALTSAIAAVSEAEAYVVLKKVAGARNTRGDQDCFTDTADHLKRLLRTTEFYDERWEYEVRTATSQLVDATNNYDLAGALGSPSAERLQAIILAIEDWRRDRTVGGIEAHPVPQVLKDWMEKAGTAWFSFGGLMLQLDGGLFVERTWDRFRYPVLSDSEDGDPISDGDD